MIMIMGDILIRGGSIYVEETDNALISQVEADVKLSTDKLKKIESVLLCNGQTTDAGLAHIAALYEYNPNKQIKLTQNSSYITLSME